MTLWRRDAHRTTVWKTERKGKLPNIGASRSYYNRILRKQNERCGLIKVAAKSSNIRLLTKEA
jgi:hypothetical protein